ncbi:hypothetical protein FJZ33_05205, partial [Candidatus Poribacteria bacterium]|nr:hypothetical protein [Candidatus Poribacteria bacterium]
MLKSTFKNNTINISKQWCLFMLLIIFSHYVFGIIINVPQNYNTIQGAINAVIDGTDEENEIIVSPQAQPYVESILIEGLTRSLTLRSTYDPDLGNNDAIANTVLKAPVAQYNNSTGDLEFYPVISIINCRGYDDNNVPLTTNKIIIQGFSVTGGTGNVVNSDANLVNYFTSGGGIYILAEGNHIYQQVEVRYCDVYDNKACLGGGLFSEYSNLTLSDTRVFNNELFYYGNLPLSPSEEDYDGPKGGGIFLDGGHSILNNVQVFKNKSYIDSQSNLYALPFNQQLHSFGNYGGLYYRTMCHPSSASVYNSSFYENVTQVDPLIVEPCEWNLQANLFFQRGIENQDSLLFKNCTVTRNRNIITTNLLHAAIGIDRYDYVAGENPGTYYNNHIINCIIYDNTEGSNLNNQSTVSTRQIIGGHTPWDGTFTTIPVKIEYSDVNNADNTDFYDAIECIDADPLFCDSQNLDFRLKWSVETKSPCIDKGYPVLYDTVYDRPDMGSFEFDEFPHQTYLYTFPAASNRHGIKWLSFPVIYNVQNNQFSNNILAGDFFTENDILHQFILDYFEWNDINTPENDMLEIIYSPQGWSNLTHMITSLQGYKVQMSPNNNQQQVIDISGFLQDYNNPPILLYNRDPITDEITENWIGYYFNRIQHVFDAFGENINNIYYI